MLINWHSGSTLKLFDVVWCPQKCYKIFILKLNLLFLMLAVPLPNHTSEFGLWNISELNSFLFLHLCNLSSDTDFDNFLKSWENIRTDSVSWTMFGNSCRIFSVLWYFCWRFGNGWRAHQPYQLFVTWELEISTTYQSAWITQYLDTCIYSLPDQLYCLNTVGM